MTPGLNDKDHYRRFHCKNFRCMFVCSIEMLRMDKYLLCILSKYEIFLIFTRSLSKRIPYRFPQPYNYLNQQNYYYDYHFVCEQLNIADPYYVYSADSLRRVSLRLMKMGFYWHYSVLWKKISFKCHPINKKRFNLLRFLINKTAAVKPSSTRIDNKTGSRT